METKIKNKKSPPDGVASLPGPGGRVRDTDLWKMSGKRLRLRLCLQNALYKTGEALGAWLLLIKEIFSK
jgi:hypothetical protein